MCRGILGLCGLSLFFSQYSSRSNVSLSVFSPALPSFVYLFCFYISLSVSFSFSSSLTPVPLYLTQSLSLPLSPPSIPSSFISARSHSRFSTFLHLHFVLCVFLSLSVCVSFCSLLLSLSVWGCPLWVVCSLFEETLAISANSVLIVSVNVCLTSSVRVTAHAFVLASKEHTQNIPIF